jgi:hypothetical protein
MSSSFSVFFATPFFSPQPLFLPMTPWFVLRVRCFDSEPSFCSCSEPSGTIATTDESQPLPSRLMDFGFLPARLVETCVSGTLATLRWSLFLKVLRLSLCELGGCRDREVYVKFRLPTKRGISCTISFFNIRNVKL